MSDNKERKAADDRRELLKIKQSRQEMLNTENEEPSSEKKPAFEKPHGAAAVKNFFYYHKVTIIIAAAVLALAAYLIIQTVNRPEYDIRALLITADYNSGIYGTEETASAALNKFCPDLNGDGKNLAEVVGIDLAADEGSASYYLAETSKFSMEIQTLHTRLIITDEGFVPFVSDENGFQADYFVDFSEDFPELELFMGRGIRIKDTKLAAEGITENAVLFLRTKSADDESENDPLKELVEELIIG